MDAITPRGGSAERSDPRISALSRLFWPLSDVERRVATCLYRCLAQGQPVPAAALAEQAGLPQKAVQETLRAWPGVFRDGDARVIGFWGLTIIPMEHQLTVDGRTLYTWCAWDTLFIPEILDRSASVRSTSAVDGAEIVFEVGPQGVTNLRAPNAMLSFVLPSDEAWTREIQTNFCHFVRFFRDADEGERWLRTRPDGFLLPLEQAYLAARLKNRYEYGELCLEPRLGIGCPLAGS